MNDIPEFLRRHGTREEIDTQREYLVDRERKKLFQGVHRPQSDTRTPTERMMESHGYVKTGVDVWGNATWGKPDA